MGDARGIKNLPLVTVCVYLPAGDQACVKKVEALFTRERDLPVVLYQKHCIALVKGKARRVYGNLKRHAFVIQLGQGSSGNNLPRHDVGDMQHLPSRSLLDLFPAAKTVGDNETVPRCPADFRQKGALGGRHGDSVFFCFESEGACHAAAAGLHHFVIEPEAVENVPLGGGIEDRVMMAVELDERAGVGAQMAEASSFLSKKFGQ
jgi:hypothetical protein